jgi:hypothetical protein
MTTTDATPDSMATAAYIGYITAEVDALRARLAAATQFTVCAVPEDHPDHNLFAITVTKCGPTSWAVQNGGWCLGYDGVWDLAESRETGTAAWLALNRHDLDTALRLAQAAAPHIKVNGVTAVEAAAQTTSSERRP